MGWQESSGSSSARRCKSLAEMTVTVHNADWWFPTRPRTTPSNSLIICTRSGTLSAHRLRAASLVLIKIFAAAKIPLMALFCLWSLSNPIRERSVLVLGHPLSTYAKVFAKLTFQTWYVQVGVRIRGLEILVFWKTLCTYLMDDPFQEWKILHELTKYIRLNISEQVFFKLIKSNQ